LLISAQVQSRQGVPLIEGAALGVFARIQLATASAADSVGGLWARYFALSGAARENEALRRRVVELEAALQGERARTAQVARLEEALGLAASLPAPTLSARVIAGSPGPGSSNVLIDRGSEDGVRTDMAVVASAGVVGRVVGTPARHAARVQLLVSNNTAAAAKLEDSGAGGIVLGGPGDPPLTLRYVSNLAPVRIGEAVLTSGQDRVYPEGFVIGTVERATRGPDLYQEIAVRPAVDFSNVEIVLVLLAQPAAGGEGEPR
jgi:rod shape-determining protein MreC